MKVINALSQGLESAPERPAGYRRSSKQIGPLLGAHALGATIYELAPRESICPYHYEYGNEEWLIVLSGEPTLRTPDGQHALEPGDAVCFREGPDGAHKVTNEAAAPARVLMLSTMHEPSISVYPDSGKVGAWPPGKLFREADAVDYWDGEAGTDSPGRSDVL